MAALLTAVSAPHSASCVEGVWTVTGSTTLAIGDAKWHINTDTVRLGSNFSSGSAAELYWSIDALDASHSGLLDLSGQYGDFGGFANYHVINWNRNYSRTRVRGAHCAHARRGVAQGALHSLRQAQSGAKLPAPRRHGCGQVRLA